MQAFFHTLIDAAEEEDFKEALLAYAFLNKSDVPLTAKALDDAIEQWFSNKYQCTLDFEISDALAKLERMQLVKISEDKYQALPLKEAKQTLDNLWDNFFNYNN